VRPPSSCWSTIAVFFGIACGTDQQGTGSVLGGHSVSDAGAAATSGSDSAGGTGEGAASSTSDRAAPTNADATNDGPGMTGVDGGTGSTSHDGATADAVAVLSADGAVLCGPCSQGQECDPALGCVNCTMDSQCPASARYCLLGNCVQCRTNTDCGNGTTPSCWPGNHTCQAPCTMNQCGDGNAPICDVTTGACVGCMSAADCPTSQGVCDPTTQQCVQCTSGADCVGTSTPACARNMCVQCATSTDCSGATSYCTSGGDNPWQCVECLQNGHCSPNKPSCNGGVCGKAGG
jgi:hypothetical protein